jgi:hypothetical protein
MLLESSVSDATIRSITLKVSITMLEVLFTLIYDFHTTGFTYVDCQWTIVMCIQYRPQIFQPVRNKEKKFYNIDAMINSTHMARRGEEPKY